LCNRVIRPLTLKVYPRAVTPPLPPTGTLGIPHQRSGSEWSMTYNLVVLNSGVERSATDLEPEVARAITAEGHWTQFFEVRMAAGPTAEIHPLPEATDGYLVTVDWGAQHAMTHAPTLEIGIEAADRLAHVFYDMRNLSTH